MPKFTDLTDRTIGSWLVLSRAENNKYGSARWNCRCACGYETTVEGHSLRSGISTNCGCARELDITGKRFNRLIAISRHPENTKNHKSQWLCRCDCGNNVIVIGSHVVNGNTTSCGCAALEVRSVNGAKNMLPDSGARSLYTAHKGAAIQRDIKFSLTFEEFKELTSGDCIYCGQKPTKIIHSRKGKSPYTYNGIDRLNSSGAYEASNCASCCSVCNYSKRTMSYDEFTAWVSRVYHYQRRRKRCA